MRDRVEDCVSALAELINSHSCSDRVRSEDDFDRVHRLGRASSTKTRPVIAKLHRSRDERALVANKRLKTDLAKVVVRLSDDHTTKQRTMLKELRRQDLTAYFRGARLISRPGPKSDTRHQAAPEDLDTLQRSSDEEHQSSATLSDAVHRLCDDPSKDQCSSDHRPTDHHSTDHRSPDHRSTDHHLTYHRSTDYQSPDHHSFDHHSQDHRSTDHHSSDHPSTDPRSTDHRPTDHHSPDHRSTDPRSAYPRSTDHRPTDHRSPDHRSTDPRSTDHHSTDHRPTDRRFPDHRSTTCFSTGRHSPDRRPDHRSSGHRHTSLPPSTSSDGPGGGTPPSGREVMNAARPRGSSRRSRSQGRSLDSPTAGCYASTSRPGAGGSRGTERPPFTDRQTRQSASGNSRQTASGQRKQRQRRIDTLLTGKRQWWCFQNGETNTLGFLHWNIGGLASKLTDPDFISYVGGFDTIALDETFPDKRFDLTNHFPDFEVFQAPAVKLTHHGRRSGGVVVLVKKRLMSFVYRIETTYEHIICLKLSSTDTYHVTVL